ncbi:MAG: MerR family transcriptional regulator [Deltaproteobacteria bacterium]
MSLGKSWCTAEEAESRYGIRKSIILKWVEDGLIRCEELDGKIVRINIDDLKLKSEENPRN